jgi:hypothetical protein
LFGAAPLFFDPLALMFGKGGGFAFGAPTGNRYSHGAIERDVCFWLLGAICNRRNRSISK